MGMHGMPDGPGASENAIHLFFRNLMQGLKIERLMFAPQVVIGL